MSIFLPVCDLDGDGFCGAPDSDILAVTAGKCLDEAGYAPLADLDGDGCVTFLESARLAPSLGMAVYVRGDANADGTCDISDAVAILSFLFLGTEKVTCEKACDTNHDGTIDLSDVVFFLGYLFLGGPAPDEPARTCGVDLVLDDLTCESFAGCRD